MLHFSTISHQTRTLVSSIARSARFRPGRGQVKSRTKPWRRSPSSRWSRVISAESRPPAGNKRNAQRRQERQRRRRRLVIKTVKSTVLADCTAVSPARIDQMRSARAVVAERGYPGLGEDSGSLRQDQYGSLPSRTITSLKRWSVGNKRELPAPSEIRAIHVYDFDNTLFLSPLPNPQLWNGPTIGFLQAYASFANGGWWHDPNLLAATGEGLEKEYLTAWEGWWNEQIVRLVQLSMEQKDALTILLTGRSEDGFTQIVRRMVDSKKLEFDLICLKPEVGPNNERFASTMEFKQAFLEDLILTYDQAEEVRIYEDRVKHVKRFRDWLEQFDRRLPSVSSGPRRSLNYDVIQVAEGCTYLSPVVETAEVQRMINSHNSIIARNQTLNMTRSPYGRLRIKRTIFYTGYLISNADSSRLINQLLLPILPYGLADSNDLKYMANSILITPRPMPRSILDKVGGIGKKLSWQITGTAVYESRVWAARLTPIPPTEKYYTDNPYPIVVLAVRRGARPIDAGKIQNWNPVPADRALTLLTEVGEKVVLRVEEENPNEGEWESQFTNKNNKRRHQQEREDDTLYPQSRQHLNGYDGPPASANKPPNQHHHYSNHPRHNDDGPPRRGSHRGGRGRGNGNRGRGSNRGGRGRGRGRDNNPNPFYKSLDDYGGHGGYDDKMNY